mgnify:CR=1 FL=1
MTVIAILNSKGGCGKTTLSTNLAHSLQRRKFKVLLVDTDHAQASARDWHAAKEDNPIPLIALDRPNNFHTLTSVASSYDFVIIDGAAKLEDIIATAVKTADLVLIPVQPSPYDLWAASELVDLIKTRQTITDGKPKAAFVISRAIEGTKLGRDINDVLAKYELPVMQPPITQRQIYPQTAARGETVFDSKNSDAIAELEVLTEEIIKYIKA